ncbi:hypothetical protein PEC18_36620 [Paucibacter sp. O1-1]|nr:hypothetical protein [Paucibacter sp. O1-1]MDA3831179.1 hypothetical protein [Paucibacter sp. O1-1]
MGAVPDASVLAVSSEALKSRVAKLVSDVDALAVVLPKAFAKSRLETVRIMARDVAERSQAVVLSMSLSRPPAEVLETVEALRALLARLRLLSSRTRIEQGTLLSIVLMETLTASLCVDLDAWQANRDAGLSVADAG